MSRLERLLAALPWRRRRPRVLSVTTRPARVHALLVPRTIVQATLAHLQAGGARGCEEFAFWSGHAVGNGTVLVSRAFHPHTRQSRGHVTVEDDAQLLAMTDIVHENDELVLCQLHTHPGEAFHSIADDQGAITDEVGFLSLVLPQFGAGGLETAETYRRTEGGWQHEGAATRLVQVFDDVLSFKGGNWRDE